MSSKYQREIEEILKQAGELSAPARPKPARKSLGRLMLLQIGQSVGGKDWSIKPGRVMLVAIGLLVSALVVRTAAPGLTAPLAWSGLLLFIVAYGMFFMRPRNRVEKRWRGQPIDQTEESLWERLRDRFKRKPR